MGYYVFEITDAFHDDVEEVVNEYTSINLKEL